MIRWPGSATVRQLSRVQKRVCGRLRGAVARDKAAALSRFRAARRKQIAGAAHRANDRRMGRIRLDLAAKARDPNIDRAVEGFAVARIGEIEQLLARQHPFRIFGEHLEQSELRAGQRKFVAAIAVVTDNPSLSRRMRLQNATNSPAGRLTIKIDL